ncbi:glycosyltransferase [Belnapia sp. T6]|uniref:Glycosyltransferase n=1 Tax=Belnapia mucosa TaxID=2804532 RepID=A0ABS1VC86_9PROT|nr:glycosyltransferase [Belnapia mucosa]MBL6458344.1 glycosyltransferase [Belnapia mucosa]
MLQSLVAPQPAPSAPVAESAAMTVTAVIVTRDRPALLARCLGAIRAQTMLPGQVLVIDNASEDESATAEAVATAPGARLVRMEENLGGAGGYRAGIALALEEGAEFVWLMDDDGYARDADCLGHLLAAMASGVALAAPLVLDAEEPERLAFPIRIAGRTRFLPEDLDGRRRIEGFAHLFNGALIAASAFRQVGLPDPRFYIRGDEVEFMHRLRRAGLPIGVEVAAEFLHPGSRAETHPIMFGLFYAPEPPTELKRYFQFRNRGYIFRAYGMWDFLLADIIRYGWFYGISRRGDVAGFARWLRATATGWRGAFLPGGPGA